MELKVHYHVLTFISCFISLISGLMPNTVDAFLIFPIWYIATVPDTDTKWPTILLIREYHTAQHMYFFAVALYKRAQILIGDIWACFHGEGLGHFTDIDTITMFADYR